MSLYLFIKKKKKKKKGTLITYASLIDRKCVKIDLLEKEVNLKSNAINKCDLTLKLLNKHL